MTKLGIIWWKKKAHGYFLSLYCFLNWEILTSLVTADLIAKKNQVILIRIINIATLSKALDYTITAVKLLIVNILTSKIKSTGKNKTK